MAMIPSGGPIDQPGGRVAQLGGPDAVLTDDEVSAFVAEQLAGVQLEGRSVCVLVPDGTRSCPLPLLLRAVHAAVHGRASRITVLIALGTHPPMDEPALAAHLGYRPGCLVDTYPGTTVINHEWWEPATFAHLGTVPAARLRELSQGRLDTDVEVLLNRAVVEHDVALVIGPVLPHEVVGMSGGNKYFFPGVAGQRIIDVSHWLGALITSATIIGTTGTTPVRALIDEGAAMIPAQRLALCVVTAHEQEGALHSLAFGEPIAAWRSAAQVSAATHIRYLDAPVARVLSLIPARYEEMWTGAKGFYKVEPVVADGGEVILYAPHIRELASSHPQILQVGYHCRDWFTGQWDRYAGVHWGVLAHSTHLRGAGSYDPATGLESLRVRVTLATAIPAEVCAAVNLGYLDPARVDLAALEADPATLVVPEAGEVLFRLRHP